MSYFTAKMHQIRFRLVPAGGAYSAPPDPLAGFKGPTSKGRGGKGMGGEGKGWDGIGGEGRDGRRGEGKGEEGRGGRERRFPKLPPLKNPRSATDPI